MKGCRPLTDKEIKKVLRFLDGKYSVRNRCLFVLGLKTGLRISELLSLKVSDVYSNDKVHDRVYLERRFSKGATAGQSIPLHPDAKDALLLLISSADCVGTYLFTSRQGEDVPIDRKHAWKILQKALKGAGVVGKTGTHCMRKSFADRVYDGTGKDIIQTARALRHKDVNNTLSYLSFNDDELDDVIINI